MPHVQLTGQQAQGTIRSRSIPIRKRIGQHGPRIKTGHGTSRETAPGDPAESPAVPTVEDNTKEFIIKDPDQTVPDAGKGKGRVQTRARTRAKAKGKAMGASQTQPELQNFPKQCSLLAVDRPIGQQDLRMLRQTLAVCLERLRVVRFKLTIKNW